MPCQAVRRPCRRPRTFAIDGGRAYGRSRANTHQRALHARHARQAVCHKGSRPVEGYLLLTPPQPSPQLARWLSRWRTGRCRRAPSRTHTHRRPARRKQRALSSRKTKSLPNGGLPPPRPTPRPPPVQPSRTSPAMIAPLRAQKTRPGDSGTAAAQTQERKRPAGSLPRNDTSLSCASSLLPIRFHISDTRPSAPSAHALANRPSARLLGIGCSSRPCYTHFMVSVMPTDASRPRPGSAL